MLLAIFSFFNFMRSLIFPSILALTALYTYPHMASASALDPDNMTGPANSASLQLNTSNKRIFG